MADVISIGVVWALILRNITGVADRCANYEPARSAPASTSTATHMARASSAALRIALTSDWLVASGWGTVLQYVILWLRSEVWGPSPEARPWGPRRRRHWHWPSTVGSADKIALTRRPRAVTHRANSLRTSTDNRQ